jgi:hypothetical protein
MTPQLPPAPDALSDAASCLRFAADCWRPPGSCVRTREALMRRPRLPRSSVLKQSGVAATNTSSQASAPKLKRVPHRMILHGDDQAAIARNTGALRGLAAMRRRS